MAARAEERADGPEAAALDGERGRVERSVRRRGLVDVAFAALYAWVGFRVAPGRAPAWNATLAVMVFLLAASGAMMVARARWARAASTVAHVALLGFCATVVALLVASAAYVRGIFGPVGEGVAAVTLVVAALVIEGCGLLPFFQLRFLLRSDVRRYFSTARGSSGGRAT